SNCGNPLPTTSLLGSKGRILRSDHAVTRHGCFVDGGDDPGPPFGLTVCGCVCQCDRHPTWHPEGDNDRRRIRSPSLENT
ncbi:hypothetical protein BaRGS_00039053, partial [Batillaria attramentaria]